MYLFENPVLQRELLVNLRMRRGFFLLFGYVALSGGIVYLAWPDAQKIDMTNPQAAQRLINLFFLGQFLVATLMAPSFAAGAITGDKERKTYEMLLASPLRPAAIVLGKLLASLCHVAILIFSSLPIVMLCLPLGGVSFYEVLAAYLAIILSVLTCGMISVACSSFFQRTAASLVVSYLLILPLALCGALFWQAFEGAGTSVRLFATVTFLPAASFFLCSVLFATTARRLLRPPDVGSEGKDVIDEDRELREAVGMVIQRDQFPDKLFAPPKRTDLLPDGANPIFDKEMHSELFSQGTLMLRVVIQVSMFLALPIMGACLYIFPRQAPWYVSYVVLFNMLVGPVFSAGSVTSERERETLDLLLVTILSPWQILWGKLISGLRISSVLTSFLLWPVLLALLMTPAYYSNLPTMLGYLLIILLTCVTTAGTALFCSVIFRKTSVSMMTSYLAVVLLFTMPLAVNYFAETFFPNHAASDAIELATSTSPFAAAFSLPMTMPTVEESRLANWPVFWGFVGFYTLFDFAMGVTMIWLFRVRWRVSH
jgi:ABC-type transport system involved in multi-copper enzyme maturation permease subunit